MNKIYYHIVYIMISCLMLTSGFESMLHAEETKKIRIVTTTTDLADIARRITADAAEVTAIASGKEDPHFLTARPGSIIEARDADVWIRIGLELEVGWEDPIIRDSRNRLIQAGEPGHIDASENVIVLDVPRQRVSRDMGDVHPFGNPHYWLDPLNGRIAAKTIAERLCNLYPSLQTLFHKNLEDFERDLDIRMFGETYVLKYGGARLWKLLLENSLARTLEKDRTDHGSAGWYGRMLPFQGQSIVTYHRSWIYLTQRFGLITALELEPKPGVPPGSRHLAEVIRTIQDQKIRLILQEPFYSRKAADLVAQKTGARVVVCPNTAGGGDGAGSYLDLLDYAVTSLAQALEAP